MGPVLGPYTQIEVSYSPKVGMWLSLVERSFRVGEVGSSNLPIPTNI